MLRLATVALAWPSLTEAVTVFVTALPPAETITREWFTGIFWLKLWLKTPGVKEADTPSSVTSYEFSTGAVAFVASKTVICSRTQDTKPKATRPAANMETILFFMVFIC